MPRRRASYLLAAAALMLAALWAGQAVQQVEPRQLTASLSHLPRQLGDWSALGPDRLLDQDSLDVLRPEAYLLRNYQNPEGLVGGLFVAYFSLQQEGQMIHSPRLCMPGAGWQIQSQSVLAVPGAGHRVNWLVMVNGLDRLSVLYWFQGRGRVEHDEYRARLGLMLDGMFLGRTEGALVRITTGVGDINPRQVAEAQLGLARGLIAAMQKLLPPAES